MVHIDAATLRKYPILGVLIGGATAVFLCYLLRSGWAEARALLDQKAPIRVSLNETVNLRRIRWVTTGNFLTSRSISPTTMYLT